MIDWKVGDKVVCVNDIWIKPRRNVEINPVKGTIYTVKEIFIGSNNEVSFLLFEIINKKANYKTLNGIKYCEAGFKASRFRPLIDKKKTTEFFEKLCIDATKKMELVG